MNKLTEDSIERKRASLPVVAPVKVTPTPLIGAPLVPSSLILDEDCIPHIDLQPALPCYPTTFTAPLNSGEFLSQVATFSRVYLEKMADSLRAIEIPILGKKFLGWKDVTTLSNFKNNRLSD